MINYFDFIVCISLAYSAAFIKEERDFAKLEITIELIIDIILIGISIYIVHNATNIPFAIIKTSLSTIICIIVVKEIFNIVNIKIFSMAKRNEKFNNENKGYTIDTDLALKILKLGKDYLETDQNVFDTDDEKIIQFNNVGELLKGYNIHSLQNFIYNIEYVKNKYNQVSTHLNEYNYINKVLYNHYNNIDDEKYNKIKEGLK